MAFDQSLISRDNGGIYAAAWIAGTSGSLAKYYKNHDIESVSVSKTCDKLNLALRTKHQLESQNCVVKENDGGIPFRICTNLFFGTLKIYQQQVDNLYKLSESLVVKSSKFEVTESATKRDKYRNHKTIKNRRLTITHTNDFDGNINVNYSQILDDLERLTQDTETNLASEHEAVECNVAPRPPCKKQLPVAKLQIREITIREINATYGIPELDDDCGFGEASNEDIIKFFTFSEARDERHTSIVKRTPSKRKSAYEEEPLEKQQRRSEGEHLNSFMQRAPSKRKSTYEEVYPEKQRRLSQGSTIEDLLNNIIPKNIDFPTTPNNVRRDILCHPSPCESTFCHKDETFADNTSPNQFKDDIKQEYISDHEGVNSIQNLSMDIKYIIPNDSKTAIKEELVQMSPMDNEKTSKLIIDHCIKLEEEEMLEQLHKPHKDLRGVTKEIFKKSKIKKRISALELLKCCNKRTSLFYVLTFKLKPHANAIQLQQEYLQLIHDILKSDYKEEWSTEIYPKWQSNFKTPPKQVKQKRIYKTPNIITEQTINCNFQNENFNIVVHEDHGEANMCLEVIKASDCLNCQTPKKIVDDNENLENLAGSNEWRPHGVMTKLLKTWRYSTEAKINANEFCHSAKTQIDKALAFFSLLSLSKSRFILVTKRFKTIEMDTIMLGITAKNLLKAN